MTNLKKPTGAVRKDRACVRHVGDTERRRLYTYLGPPASLDSISQMVRPPGLSRPSRDLDPPPCHGGVSCLVMSSISCDRAARENPAIK